MKKIIVAITFALTTFLFGAINNTAHAWPSNCTYFFAGMQAYGKCTSGYGTYRVMAVNSIGQHCYGQRVGVGWGWSVAQCWTYPIQYVYMEKSNY